MSRDEYKVNMKDARGHKSFTLANADSPEEAQRMVEKQHAKGDRPKTVIAVEKTGRSF